MTTNYRFAIAAAALVLSASCGGYSSPTTPTTTTGGSGTEITIPAAAESKGSAAYVPNPVTIPAGTSVTWMNNDSVAHTATSDTGAFGGSLAPGARYSYTFQTRGSHPYHCTLHPGMVGTVVVQ